MREITKTAIVSLIVIAMLMSVLPTTASASLPTEQTTLNPKIDPYLHIMLGDENPVGLNSMMSAGVEMISVFLETNGDFNARARLEANGVVVRSVIGNIMTANIPRNAINAVADMPEIVYIEGDKPMQLQMDVSRPEIGAEDVQKALYTPAGGTATSVTGKGVIIGIIDTGIDYTHPDFWIYADDGITPQSRILKLWDQAPAAGTYDLGSIPAGLYGLEYNTSDINTALAHDRPHDYVAQRDTVGHGTHVAGIAAGNGRGDARYKGVAPEADIVVVKLENVEKINETQYLTHESRVMHAINYTVNYANINGKPLVISISGGSNWGPHDGTSLLEKVIDDISRSGVVIVNAAGNEGDKKAHSSGDVTQGSIVDIPFTIPATTEINHASNHISIWYEKNDWMRISFISPDGRTYGPYDYDTTDTFSIEDLVFPDYISFGFISEINNSLNGDNYILININNCLNDDQLWKIRLHGLTINNGHFDSWSICYNPPAICFIEPDSSNTITTPGTSQSVITVGSYNTRGNDANNISWFSSHGPTRHGGPKPEISAPGYYIKAPNSRDVIASIDYCIKEGTSMAAPHVAGTIALMLQLEPELNSSAIKTKLNLTAKKDTFTGTNPNPDIWGYGKIDALAITGMPSITVASKETVEIYDRTVNLSIEKSPIIGSALSQMRFANDNTYIPRWYTEFTTIQSTHPVYPGDTKTVSLGYMGATKMKIHFEKIDIRTCDHIYIKDSSGNVLNDLSGPYLTGITWENNPETDGDVGWVEITMVINSVNSWNGYGFKIDYWGYYTSKWSSWEPYRASKSWILSEGIGDKLVYCEASDVSGNHYLTFDEIRYSQIPILVVLNDLAEFTSSKYVDMEPTSTLTPTQMRITNSEYDSWYQQSTLSIENVRDYWWHLTEMSPAINPYPNDCSAGISYTVDLRGGTGMVLPPSEATAWRVNFAYVHLMDGDYIKFEFYDGLNNIWRTYNEYSGPLHISPMDSFEIPKTTLYGNVRMRFYSYNNNPQSPFAVTSYEWRNNNLYYSPYFDQTWTISGDPYAPKVGINFEKIDLGSGDRLTVYHESGNILDIRTGPITLTNHFIQGENNDNINVRLESINPETRGWGIKINSIYCFDKVWLGWIPWASTYNNWNLFDYGGTTEDGIKTVYVQAKDNLGNIGIARDTIILDTQSPISPTISSFTHPNPDVWYSNNDPGFTWVISSDNSGIAGYYYDLDQQPTDTLNADWSWTTGNSVTFNGVSDGTWYLHVCSKDNAGLTSPLVHFKINIFTGPLPPAPATTCNIPLEAYTNVMPAFTWVPPIDASGIAGYSYALDYVSTTIPDTTIDTTDTSRSYSWLASGIYYFHLRAKNNASIWGDTAHVGPLHIDTDLPTTPSSITSSHGSDWTTNANPSFTWAASSDPRGISEYGYAFDHFTNTAVTSSSTTDTTISFTNVADGVWYFHVRAMDNAGNWGLIAHYGPIKIDRTPATSYVKSLPIIIDTSPIFTVSWTGAYVQRYEIQYREDTAGVWTDWYSGTSTSQQFCGKDGHTYYFRSRAIDASSYVEAYPGGDGDASTIISCVWLGDLEGHVFMQGTSTPVAGTQVDITIGHLGPAPEVRTTVTDANGYYSFTNVPMIGASLRIVVRAWYYEAYAEHGTWDFQYNQVNHLDMYVPTVCDLKRSYSFYWPNTNVPRDMPYGWTSETITVWDLTHSTHYGRFVKFNVNDTIQLPIGVTYRLDAVLILSNGDLIGNSIIVTTLTTSQTCTVRMYVGSFGGSGSTGSCPCVYGWNGTAYFLENTILEGDGLLATPISQDTLVLGETSLNSDTIKCKIVEEETNEYSILDSAHMLYMNYEPGVTLGVTPDGEICGFCEPMAPVFSIDESGNDVTELVNRTDENVFNGTVNSNIIVMFEWQGEAIEPKLVVRSDACTHYETYENITGVNGPIIVQMMIEDGTWLNVTHFWPHNLWTETVIDLGEYVETANASVVVRLVWESYHLLDYVGLNLACVPDIEIRKSPAISARHSSGLDVTDTMRYADNTTLMLDYGEYVSLEFPEVPNINVDAVALKVSGKYVLIQRPFARLTADAEIVQTYESITFDASTSIVDNSTQIVKYWFNFGDGTNTGWIDYPIVNHSYGDGPREYGAFVKVIAMNGWMSVNSALVFVEVQNREPIPIINVYQKVDISLRVTGRMDNIVGIRIYEDGALIQSHDVLRTAGPPNTITIDMNKYLGRNYTIELVFEAEHMGSNPTWLNFTSGDISVPFFKDFNTRDGFYQVISVSKCYLNCVVASNPAYNFDASGSYDLDGEIVFYSWEFGDGTTTQGMTTQYAYSEPGQYTVTLTVIDDDGALAKETLVVEVY